MVASPSFRRRLFREPAAKSVTSNCTLYTSTWRGRFNESRVNCFWPAPPTLPRIPSYDRRPADQVDDSPCLWLTGQAARRPVARWVWTTGCGLFLVHVACAFHFYHDWSHAAAWHDTAEQTRELLGVAFGNGIYFSYLFLALWVLDVAWLWTLGSTPFAAAQCASGVPPLAAAEQRTPRWRVLVHAFLLFIAFNGDIVFEAGPTRSAGIVACCGLTALFGSRAYNRVRGRRQVLLCENVHNPRRSERSDPHSAPSSQCVDVRT
jgi:hypothetical protein